MNATFDHSEDVAKNIKTFWFKPEKPVSYIAGQFTELYLPHANADNRGERRWLTLSSSPTEPLLGVTTKFASGRSSTFMQTLSALTPGAVVKLADPMGDFVLPKNPAIPLIFVAAGIGITPMRSMIKWLSDTGEQRSVHLIYALSSITELAFEALFKGYDLTYTPIIKQPPTNYSGQTGQLDASQILRLVRPSDSSLLYLSGPETLVETLTKDLLATGIPTNRLATDYFPGYN